MIRITESAAYQLRVIVEDAVHEIPMWGDEPDYRDIVKAVGLAAMEATQSAMDTPDGIAIGETEFCRIAQEAAELEASRLRLIRVGDDE